MIFQDPMTSLNPVYTVGNQLCEPLMLHLGLASRGRGAGDRPAEAGRHSGRGGRSIVSAPVFRGMRQRVMIAMALACNPKVLIADEPTTALDVTIQAQILDLMAGLNRDFGTAIVLITHDLGVVAEVCQRVVVMYAGKVVEGRERSRFVYVTNASLYRWTALIDSRVGRSVKEKLVPIGGLPPDFLNPPEGCRFAPRCSRRQGKCASRRRRRTWPTSQSRLFTRGSMKWRDPLRT